MCGIYGNINHAEFYRLYKLNKSRGSYSTGFLFIDNKEYEVKKTNEDVSYYPIALKKYYLGHNRAPTTDENGKGLTGCHPFIYGKAIAAHNGIISNTDILENEYKIKFDVDSQWIPFLYDYFKRNNNQSENAFRLALLELEGTYGIWLYDIDEEIVFVSRSDNTVYWDDEKISFTSIRDDMHKNLMPQGAIYKKENNEPFKDINENNRLNIKQKYFII
jgi:glucosamine 6-phosphate synthetase-like amidotransferase/phosphosugar isomerase protein